MREKIFKILTLLWGSLMDFIFPPSKEMLCVRTISPVNIFKILPESSTSPYPFIKSIFAYKNSLVETLVWNIKYKKDIHSLRCGGYALYTKLAEINNDKNKKILLVPIPISKQRRRERGYNQCELIIDEIIKLDKDSKFEKAFDFLIRVKHAARQTMKDREERLKNIENVFEIKKMLDKEADIVVIDDVTTTGSTLREACLTIRNAGYMNVQAYTLAH